VSEIETSDGERRLIHHSAFASSLYIRISASRIGIYQGDPIVSVRFLIEERVRSTSYVVAIPDMHNEAIRLNTDKTARRSLPLRSAAKRRARKHSAVLHRNYPWALPCSYTPEETLQNSFAFWVGKWIVRARALVTTPSFLLLTLVRQFRIFRLKTPRYYG